MSHDFIPFLKINKCSPSAPQLVHLLRVFPAHADPKIKPNRFFFLYKMDSETSIKCSSLNILSISVCLIKVRESKVIEFLISDSVRRHSNPLFGLIFFLALVPCRIGMFEEPALKISVATGSLDISATGSIAIAFWSGKKDIQN